MQNQIVLIYCEKAVIYRTECNLRHVVNVQVSGKALHCRVWYNAVILKRAIIGL